MLRCIPGLAILRIILSETTWLEVDVTLEAFKNGKNGKRSIKAMTFGLILVIMNYDLTYLLFPFVSCSLINCVQCTLS